MYSPLIQKIEVLKLEKRLDDELYYLRDCLPEYSSFPVDMESIPHVPGAPVPVNPIKVKFRTDVRWSKHWETFDLKGVENYWEFVLRYRKTKYLTARTEPWKQYDLIEHYRKGVTREDEETVYGEMMEFQDKHVIVHKGKRKKIFSYHRDKPQHS